MEHTATLQLVKPAQNENYNVDQFNENADKIDAHAAEVKAALEGKGAPNGLATLDEEGKLTEGQRPAYYVFREATLTSQGWQQDPSTGAWSQTVAVAGSQGGAQTDTDVDLKLTGPTDIDGDMDRMIAWNKLAHADDSVAGQITFYAYANTRPEVDIPIMMRVVSK